MKMVPNYCKSRAHYGTILILGAILVIAFLESSFAIDLSEYDGSCCRLCPHLKRCFGVARKRTDAMSSDASRSLPHSTFKDYFVDNGKSMNTDLDYY